ncbi:MAG: BatA domain-containing protein [Planctomycetota bacterium]|nr:BatA domain-containing protein [Planctomycetota bacterium]
MSFVHPILLWAGLASIAIPIAIHLLMSQRRRPVEWGAMRFLIEAYRKQKQRLRVEQLLLLLARCLLLAALAAALGRPMLESAGLLAGGAGRTVYILLDDSVASGVVREGSGESALAEHKRRALEIVSSLGPSDRAGLILLGGPARAVVSPASPDLAAVRRLIEEASSTDAAADLAGALEAAGAALGASDEERSRPASVVVLSDFTVGSADVSRPLPAALGELPGVRVLASRPAEAGSAGVVNVQVTAIEPLRPVVLTGGVAEEQRLGEREQVRVVLRRTGPGVAEGGVTSLRVRGAEAGAPIEGSLGSQASVRWQPGQAEATVSVQVDPVSAGGEGAASMILTAEIDRDALAADNVHRRVVGVRDALRVGVIARGRFGSEGGITALSAADWIRLALRPTAGTPIEVVDIEPAALDGAALAGLEAAFAPAPDLLRDEDWTRLARFVEGGGLLVVSPPADASVHLWSDGMIRALGLPWRVAREARTIEGGVGVDEASVEASGLLSLIAAELPSLARPVSVFRQLGAESIEAPGRVLLGLRDGSALAVAVSGAERALEGAGSGGSGGAGGSRGGERGAGRGLVVYLTSAPVLSWTDLPAKPLMVPLVQELVRQGAGAAAGSSSGLAGRPVEAPARSRLLRPVGEGAEIVVGDGGVTAEAVRRAGVWLATDESGRARGVVTVNADADGARTGVQDPGAVGAWLRGAMGEAAGEMAGGTADERLAWLDDAQPTAGLSGREGGSPLALPLLIAAAVLAVAELVMARFFSHAWREA